MTEKQLARKRIGLGIYLVEIKDNHGSMRFIREVENAITIYLDRSSETVDMKMRVIKAHANEVGVKFERTPLTWRKELDEEILREKVNLHLEDLLEKLDEKTHMDERCHRDGNIVKRR